MVQLAETRVAAPTAWKIDPAHTSVEFAIKHLMISTVKGHFGGVDATLRGSPDDPAAVSAEAVIDVSTIDTGIGDRDAHLRSADFFDVENFPTIRYASRSVRPLGDGEFEAEGDLTIRDVTRPVTLRATLEGQITDPWGNERVGLSAEGKISRGDFGLTWNNVLEAGGVVIGDDVRLTIHAEAVRQAA